MERIELPLSKLSLAQKLDLMEAIWEDLTHDEKKFESPDWHEDILKQRESSVAAGNQKIFDWDDAKKRILKKARPKRSTY